MFNCPKITLFKLEVLKFFNKSIGFRMGLRRKGLSVELSSKLENLGHGSSTLLTKFVRNMLLPMLNNVNEIRVHRNNKNTIAVKWYSLSKVLFMPFVDRQETGKERFLTLLKAGARGFSLLAIILTLLKF